MPKNECSTCGGGLNEYTAPEARCICNKEVVAAKKQKGFKHDLLVIEQRWLTAHGWVSVDIVNSANDGFNWKTKTGEGPFSQQDAVNTQKDWDKNPQAKDYFELEQKAMHLNKEIEAQRKAGQPADVKRKELVDVIASMVKITKREEVVELRPS